MESPSLEFAFTVNLQASPFPEMGMTVNPKQKVIAIHGGSVKGSQIKGTILPGGYDWQLIRNDGVIEINARYVLQTEEGVLITVVNTGFRYASEEVMQRLSKGEEIDPSLYYFRSTFHFETNDPTFDWLTKNIFIGNGMRKPTAVTIEVWKVV